MRLRVRDNTRPCAGRQFYASSDEPYPGLVVGTGVEDYFDSSYYLWVRVRVRVRIRVRVRVRVTLTLTWCHICVQMDSRSAAAHSARATSYLR